MPINFIKFNVNTTIEDLFNAKSKLANFITKHIHLYEYKSLNGKSVVSKLIIDRENGISKIKELQFNENKKKISSTSTVYKTSKSVAVVDENQKDSYLNTMCQKPFLKISKTTDVLAWPMCEKS